MIPIALAMVLFCSGGIVYAQEKSESFIGPKETKLEKVEPEDYGLVIVPKDIFPEGNGAPIPIYIPPVINDSNAFFDDWSNVKEITGEDVRFSKEKLLRNLAKLSLSGVSGDLRDPRPGAGARAVFSMTAAVLLAFERSFEENGFKITIQRNPQGNFRAVIEISADEMNVIRTNAGGIISSLTMAPAAAEFSQYLKDKFSLPDGLYRAFWIIDKNHKQDLYVVYMGIRPDKDAVLIVPKIYSQDIFEITKYISLPVPGPTVLKLQGKSYVNVWSYILPVQAPEALKILELLPISSPVESKAGFAIALVVDRSGSMTGEKLAKAKQAADSFFAGLGPSDYSCLVTFCGDAVTEIELLQVVPENKRKLQADIGFVQAGGSTNIGAGLIHGLHQLKKVSDSIRKSALLLSDGRHNTGELWPVVEEYEKRRWSVYTIAYGSDADQKTLAQIARRTGGTFFPASLPNITQVYHKISAHAHNQSVLFSYNDLISQGKQINYQTPINPDISSVTFFADWQGSRVDLHLQTPEGKKINPDNFNNFPGVSYQKGDTFCFYQVDEPKPGNWQATLFGKKIDQSREQVNFTVSGSSPLLVNIFGFQPDYRQGEVIQITAKVLGLFGLEPEILKDVKVTAEIKKPVPNLKKMLKRRLIDLGKFLRYALTKKKTLTLYDDGRHGDGEASDGIFSAEYKEADENGCYLVTVKCEVKRPNNEKMTRILKESIQVGPIEDNKVTLADFLGL